MSTQLVVMPSFSSSQRSPAAVERRRVLVVDDDPATLLLIQEILRSEPLLLAPALVESAEAALRLLGSEERFDCLLADIVLPGMDGLQLLLAARELRPALKIVVMTTSPSDDLRRAVLEAGVSHLLSKPLDFEELLVSLGEDRPGSLAHLAGDLDLLDLWSLSAACQVDGGLKLWNGQAEEGLLAHQGGALLHAETGGLVGPPAFERLRAWGDWRFESLPAARRACLPVSCDLPLASAGPRSEGAKASGSLRGLTLRHLIEWAMEGRETCTLTLSSRGRTGVLSFDAGKIQGAETADCEGGRAAAEILRWESLRVELRRAPAAAPARQGKRDGLEALLDRFSEDVAELVATGVVRLRGALPLATHSVEPGFDAGAAADGYASLVEAHLLAIGRLGVGVAWEETEDILITTARTYVLIRVLGGTHYHWLVVSRDANLALCRLAMRSYEPFLLSGLVELGEPSPDAPG